MAIFYYKLFDMLQRRGMKRGDLIKQAKLNWPTIAKMNKGQTIQTDNINRICAALDCQPGDIMEFRSDEESE